MFLFWSILHFRSSQELGCFWAVAGQHRLSLHRFSIGLRPEHSRTLTSVRRSHSFVATAMCLGLLSCWHVSPWRRFLSNISPHYGSIRSSLNLDQSSFPLCGKAFPNHNASASVLHNGCLFLRQYFCIPPCSKHSEWLFYQRVVFWSYLTMTFS